MSNKEYEIPPDNNPIFYFLYDERPWYLDHREITSSDGNTVTIRETLRPCKRIDKKDE